jgi:hypothetical protein
MFVCLFVCVRVQICCTWISVSLKDWCDSESGALVNICSEERVDVSGGGGDKAAILWNGGGGEGDDEVIDDGDDEGCDGQ